MQEDLRPGDPFPTDRALVCEFGVSRETIREALRGLAKDGWIVRHRGTGTVVARGRPQTTDRRLTGLGESLSDLTDDTRTTVLKKGIVRVPLEGVTIAAQQGEYQARVMRTNLEATAKALGVLAGVLERINAAGRTMNSVITPAKP